MNKWLLGGVVLAGALYYVYSTSSADPDQAISADVARSIAEDPSMFAMATSSTPGFVGTVAGGSLGLVQQSKNTANNQAFISEKVSSY